MLTPCMGPWLAPMPRGWGRNTCRPCAASNAARWSKSAALRPNEGSNTIAGPLPCEKYSMHVAPLLADRVEMVMPLLLAKRRNAFLHVRAFARIAEHFV